MPDPSTPRDENTQALYSLFCGVIGVPTAFIYIGVLFGVMAVILGQSGLQRSHSGEGRQEMAIAGLALGAISVVIFFALLVS